MRIQDLAQSIFPGVCGISLLIPYLCFVARNRRHAFTPEGKIRLHYALPAVLLLPAVSLLYAWVQGFCSPLGARYRLSVLEYRCDFFFIAFPLCSALAALLTLSVFRSKPRRGQRLSAADTGEKA